MVLKIREKTRKVTNSLHWFPGHEGIRDNERANAFAQQATEDSRPMPDPATEVLISTIYAKAKSLDFELEHSEVYNSLVQLDEKISSKSPKYCQANTQSRSTMLPEEKQQSCLSSLELRSQD